MGEGRRRCRTTTWDEGTGGAHKGYFHIPDGMVVRGGRRHLMPTSVAYVTDEHFVLVKGALT